MRDGRQRMLGVIQVMDQRCEIGRVRYFRHQPATGAGWKISGGPLGQVIIECLYG